SNVFRFTAWQGDGAAWERGRFQQIAFPTIGLGGGGRNRHLIRTSAHVDIARRMAAICAAEYGQARTKGVAGPYLRPRALRTVRSWTRIPVLVSNARAIASLVMPAGTPLG